MQDFRELFLSQFDRSVAKGIIEFGKKLMDTKTDVFILMARKAACFVECLEELSLTRLNGHVTTDRVLDMDLSWLRDRSVTIVDDAIVSGTTIYETINVLKRAEVKSIEVVVICVNDEWFTESLLIEGDGSSYLKEPFMRLKNEECIKLCSDIVTALSIFPRPYSVDFPIYKNTRISERIFDQVLENSFWECDDISSVIQSEHNVVSLTLTPNELFINTLDNLLGFPFSKTAMCKIRLYGFLKENTRSGYSRNRTSANSTRNFYNVKVLPLIVLKPIRTEDIEALFGSVVNHFKIFAPVLEKEFISAHSKLRLIQHLAASYLGRQWVQSISHITTSKISLYQDRRALNFLYPPHIIEMVEKIISGDCKVFVHATYNPVQLGSYNQFDEFTSAIKDVNPLSANVKLTEPFLYLYHEKELNARREVKKHKKDVFRQPLYKDLMGRLKKGYSLNYLQNILSKDFEERQVNKIVSLFLDRAIDKGIVVPITGEKEGVLFRAYRHGEDVIFGEMEEKLCLVMLKTFLESSGRDAAPHLISEKLLVLLIKIGVQKNFLREFIYDNSPRELIQIVSVKNYKFGQVTKVQELKPEDPRMEPVYIRADQKSEWLTFVLLEKKLLLNKGGKNFYAVADVDTTDINAHASYEAQHIGDIFGLLDRNGRDKIKPTIGEKELVKLTSCLFPNDIAASMAAELFIFKTRWPGYRKDMVTTILQDNAQYNKLYELMRGIRHENDAWTAINSGQDKFIDFKERAGQALIEEIRQFFKGIHARIWMQFWPGNLNWKDSEVPEQLKILIDKEAIWLFETNILMRLLDLLFCKLLQLTCMDKVAIENINQQISILQEEKRMYRQYAKAVKDIDMSPGKLEYKQTLQNKVRKIENRIKLLNGEIAHVEDWMPLQKEIEEMLAHLTKYTTYDSPVLLTLIEEVGESLGDGDLPSFTARKMIKKISRSLDKKVNEATLILEKIDLVVSPMGKVNYYHEYTDVLFLDIDFEDNHERIKWEHIVSTELVAFEKETFLYKEQKGQQVGSFHLLSSDLNKLKKGFLILGRGFLASSRLVALSSRIYRALIKAGAVFDIFYFPNLPMEMRFKIQAKNNAMVSPGFFYENARKIIAPLSKRSRKPYLYVSVASQEEFIEFKTSVAEKSDHYFEPVQQDEIKDPSIISNHILSFAPRIMDQIFDIGIITVIEPEYNAVKKILEAPVLETGKKTRRLYLKGFLPGAGTRHTVVMSQQSFQGNESVDKVMMDMVDEFKPRIMILFGIGGSIADDFTIGDVCIANQVIDYTKVKVRDEEKITHRGTSYSINPVMQVYVNHFFNEYGEFAELPSSPEGFSSKFKVRSGPVGSGNAVIGSSSAAIKKWLLEFNEKALLVETEALGFSHTQYEQQLSRDNQLKGTLIIRGVSDQADVAKNDKWRKVAAGNAALVLQKLMALFPAIDTL